jgi:hypothetical protein
MDFRPGRILTCVSLNDNDNDNDNDPNLRQSVLVEWVSGLTHGIFIARCVQFVVSWRKLAWGYHGALTCVGQGAPNRRTCVG